jgi:hypothetical protein
VDELAFYVKRANGIFGAIATTPFILAGLGMVVAGFVIAAGDTKDANGGYVLVITVVLFVGFAVGGPVLAHLKTAHHSLWEWIGSVAVWLLLTAFFAAGGYYLVRELRQPGLILHAGGFEFEKQTWAWIDIEDIRPADGSEGGGLRTVFRPDRPLPAAPAELPFQPYAFATEGRPVDAILREWLQRYRTRDA